MKCLIRNRYNNIRYTHLREIEVSISGVASGEWDNRYSRIWWKEGVRLCEMITNLYVETIKNNEDKGRISKYEE
jgi:hypothetical protein